MAPLSLVQYLRKLLAAVRIPFIRSFRQCLLLWRWIRLCFTRYGYHRQAGKSISNRKKFESGRDDSNISASREPIHWWKTFSVGPAETTQGLAISPISANSRLSPYGVTSYDTHGSSMYDGDSQPYSKECARVDPLQPVPPLKSLLHTALEFDLHNPSAPLAPLRRKPKIIPTTGIGRYQRNITTIHAVDKLLIIPPLTTSFSHDDLPNNWTPIIHPEGALYWVHKERPIYTDAYLCDKDKLSEIDFFLQTIDEGFVAGKEMPQGWELVLELSNDQETEEPLWSYYCVDPRTRTLFWFHEFPTDNLSGGISGVRSMAHMRFAIEGYYWAHWETFPHNKIVPTDVLRDLQDVLIHAGVDFMTSRRSPVCSVGEDSKKLLEYVKSFSNNGGNDYCACIVGRLMSFFSQVRFTKFHGQECARISSNQNIFDDDGSGHRSFQFLLISAFLFFAPGVYLKILNDIYTEFYQYKWAPLGEKLRSEWQTFILYASVILTANVAFLAIPGVDIGRNKDTAIQIASYISLISSVGSIVCGLLLIRQSRVEREHGDDFVDNFSRKRRYLTRRLMLATVYSLPWSLLMWAMVALAVALALDCFDKPSSIYTRIPTIVVGVIVGVLVLSCIIIVWEKCEPLDRHLLWKKKQDTEAEEAYDEPKRIYFFYHVAARILTQTLRRFRSTV